MWNDVLKEIFDSKESRYIFAGVVFLQIIAIAGILYWVL
jgi:hypothetical protein